MIEFENVTFTYDGKTLFERLNVCIPDGEKVVVAGPSGTGKSTFLSCIPGFARPVGGEIRVDGLPVEEKNISTIRSLIAWVPQEFTLPYEYVNEMVDAIFSLRANRKCKPSAEAVAAVFARLGLAPGLYRKRLTETSGGQRQRIMLGIAALLDKKILLLDEPTSALDHESVAQVIGFLKEMKGKTVVAVSHDAQFIGAFDREIRLGETSPDPVATTLIKDNNPNTEKQ